MNQEILLEIKKLVENGLAISRIALKLSIPVKDVKKAVIENGIRMILLI